VYSESYYPRLHFGWSELKAVRSDRHKIIVSPQPELYDLVADPDESDDAADRLNTAFATLSARVAQFDALYSEGAERSSTMELDEETRSRLAALGYLSTFVDTDEDGADLPNPRDKIGIYNDLLRAKQLKLRGEVDEAVELLESIVASDPGVIDAHVTLGTLYSQLGRYEEAIATYEEALGYKPGDLSLVLLTVSANVKLTRFERALQVITDFEDLLPEDPRLYFTRGNIHRYLGHTEAAVGDYRRSVAINGDAAPAWAALSGALVQARRFDEARTAVDRALDIDAAVPDANFVLGQLLQRDGDLQGAEAAYLRELENSPDHLRSAYNLSIVYRELGREPAEERYLRRAIEINPEFPLAPLYLARLYMRAGQNLDTAIRMAEWATNQELADPDLAFAYFLLTDLYNRTGDTARAAANLRRGEALRRRILGR
jgi:tetratricopeptide (TPR) repeat protein